MYILTQHTSDKAPRAYRISDDQPETVPSWVAWALMMALSLLLTAAALAFAVYLPAMWRVLL
jgi:hypothetical protein